MRWQGLVARLAAPSVTRGLLDGGQVSELVAGLVAGLRLRQQLTSMLAAPSCRRVGHLEVQYCGCVVSGPTGTGGG